GREVREPRVPAVAATFAPPDADDVGIGRRAHEQVRTEALDERALQARLERVAPPALARIHRQPGRIAAPDGFAQLRDARRSRREQLVELGLAQGVTF